MKNKILDAAAQLILQYGLKKFTVDEIAAELKISKKTVYKYFKSKDDIIREYFEIAIESDKSSVLKTLRSEEKILKKIHEIIYSNHRYRLPVVLLNEVRKFYPDEWVKIQNLKQFKLDATKKLLQQGSLEGIFKSDIHFEILLKMLENISDMFIDYDFLVENKLKTTEAIDEALKIIFNGILKEEI